MKFKKLAFILISCLALSSCANEGTKSEVTPNKATESESNLTELKKYNEVVYEYFDTVTAFTAYAKDDDEYKKYKETLVEDLKKYHEIFNGYYDFDGVNNIKTINENAGIKPVEVAPELIELIEYGFEVHDITDGKINIALGSLLGLWHDYREEAISDPSKASIPSIDELNKVSKASDINNIVIDKENNTVFLKDPDTKLDVGAIGKGYAVKKIAQKLEESGLKHGILSVGGDDVMIGSNPSKEDGLWKIAIQNPDLKAKDPYSSIVGVKYTTVVTSGDYQRFYEYDGKRYHHIIDPDTMYPSDYFRSVSVIHEDIALADTLSTYLFLVDKNKGEEVANKYGAEVLWIDKDQNMYKTPGWEKLED